MARRLGILLVCMLCLASPALADEAKEQGERLDAIVRLAQAGVADAVIVKHIQTSGFVFYLSADDILELRSLNVSDAVIEALIDTAVGQEPQQRTNRIVYEPETSLYVGVSAGYYSPWYWYPYAWGFYYDPFPSCYSYYYYPFGCSWGWGYYGHGNYYYPTYYSAHRYDHWPYYNELARRHGGGVNVPVVGSGGIAVSRASRSAAGVDTPVGPRRFARAEANPRRDVSPRRDTATPRLDTSRRNRSRVHTRDAGAVAVNTPRASRRWSTPTPRAQEVSRPAERRSSGSPTRHLQPSSSGMRVRQGSSAAAPSRAAPSRSVSQAFARSAPSASAPRAPSGGGSRLRMR